MAHVYQVADPLGPWPSCPLFSAPFLIAKVPIQTVAVLFIATPTPCHTQLYPPCPGQKDDPSWTLYPLLALLWLWLMLSGFLHDWTPPRCQQTSSSSDLMALPKDWGIVTSSYSTTIYSPALISQHAILHITHSGFGTHLKAPQAHHLFSQLHTSVHVPPSISPPRGPHVLSLASSFLSLQRFSWFPPSKISCSFLYFLQASVYISGTLHSVSPTNP